MSWKHEAVLLCQNSPSFTAAVQLKMAGSGCEGRREDVKAESDEETQSLDGSDMFMLGSPM